MSFDIFESNTVLFVEICTFLFFLDTFVIYCFFSHKMICRLCLSNLFEESAVFLFETTAENHTETKLAKMIAKYFYLEISEDDPVSTTICEDCCEHLEDFHRFWVYVDQKQNTLRNEFLEVKCDVLLPSTGNTSGDGIHGADNEELMVDLKNVPTLDNLEHTEMVTLHDNFEGTTEIDKKFDIDENMDFDTLASNDNDGNSSMDDDIPLLSLRTKVKSKAKAKGLKRDSKSSSKRKGPKLRKLKQKKEYACKKHKTAADRETFREISKRNAELIDNFMKLNCDMCNQAAENYNDLRLHFHAVHERAPYIKCCGSTYNKPSQLVEHIKWHQDPSAYMCEICSKKLRTKKCLQVHKELAHGTDDGPIHISNCHICNKEFRSKKCFEKHIQRHENEKTYTCELCHKCFATPQRLRRHIESIHDNIFPHICEICGKKFKFKPSFERHLLEHQGIIEPTVQCTLCGEWLKNKHAWRLHQFKHDNSDCECKICGRICVSRTALRGHVSYMHKTEKNLNCKFCDKTFKVSKNLEEHMAIHTGAQLYSCPHCTKECRSKANMYVHIKRYHVQEWIKSKIARSNDPNLKTDAASQ